MQHCCLHCFLIQVSIITDDFEVTYNLLLVLVYLMHVYAPVSYMYIFVGYVAEQVYDVEALLSGCFNTNPHPVLIHSSDFCSVSDCYIC